MFSFPLGDWGLLFWVLDDFWLLLILLLVVLFDASGFECCVLSVCLVFCSSDYLLE